jgi:superfamily II DNA or RNA helicase
MESFRNNLPFKGFEKEKNEENLFTEKKEETPEPIKCLVSVSKLTTGFSVNDIDLGVIVRPTKILSLWHQMAGRMRRKSDKLDEILNKLGEKVEYDK